MFNRFRELIITLFNNILKGEKYSLSINDYFQVAALSLALIAVIAFFILIMFCTSYWIPFKGYQWFTGATIKRLNDLYNQIPTVNKENTHLQLHSQLHDAKEFIEIIANEIVIKKELKKRKIVYWTLFVTIYVPLLFPLILILLDVSMGVFR